MKLSHLIPFVLLCGVCRAAETPPPAGYTVVKKTDFGRIMTVTKDKPKTVATAIDAVLDDLDDFFDDDYTCSGAFENQADHKSGFAAIQAKYNGQPVRGFVSATLTDHGVRGLVIFVNNNAPPTAWGELTGKAAAAPAAGGAANAPAANAGDDKGNPLAGEPSNGGGAAGNPLAGGNDKDKTSPAPEPAAPPVPPQLTEYQFPDGTGSIGLAEGWTTDAKSCQGTFIIKGPNSAHVTVGVTFSVNEPNSTAVQLARQYGTGGIIFLVGHIAEPADAFAEIGPQVSKFLQSKGQPGFELDHVAKAKDLPPIAQGNKLALITYGVTRNDGENAGHYQAMSEISVTPLNQQAWLMWVIEMCSRDEKSKEQMPAMIAMVNSWKVNQQAVNAITQGQIAKQNQWFEAQQAGHRAQTEANDAQQAQYWKDSNARSRMNDNADEALRGVRDLEDTTTGELHSVDLGSIDQLQTKLNEVDPDRWKQVPLRDKVDPVPAGR